MTFVVKDTSIKFEKKEFYSCQKNFADFLKHSSEFKHFLSSLGVVDFFSVQDFSKRFFKPCVYVLYCKKSRKYYVGETCNKGERVGDHLKALENGNHENLRLQNDWNLYGSNSFIVFTVLENTQCESLAFRLNLENSIVRIDPNFCYNKDASLYVFECKNSLKALTFTQFKKRVQEVIFQLTSENVKVPVDVLHNRIVPCVYIFFCLKNNFFYIGETVDKFSRLSRHIKLLESGKHENPRLQTDWTNFGSNSFLICSIMEGDRCFSKLFRKNIEAKGIKANPLYSYNKEACKFLRDLAQEENVQQLIFEKCVKPVNVLGLDVNQNILKFNGKPDLLQKIRNSGKDCNFIFVGILYFNSSADSAVEYFCGTHKLFITKTWESWNRCFSRNNNSYRPACCEAGQKNKALNLTNQKDLKFNSNFSIVPQKVSFTVEEQKEILFLLCKSKKTYVPTNVKKELPALKQDRHAFIVQEAARLNADVVSIEGFTAKSKVILFCRNCQKENKGTELSLLANQTKLRCCTDKQKASGIPEKLKEKMETFGHEVVGQPPRTKKDRFSLYCKEHNITTETTLDQYRAAKFGMRCCALVKGDRANSLRNLQ